MPTFDVVSEVAMNEVTNAVDQVSREIVGRFDFKGTKASIALEGDKLQLTGDNDFQLKQIFEILINKCTKRDVDTKCLKVEKPEITNNVAKQNILIRQGLTSELAKIIVKKIKDSKLKIQPSIQGTKVRVSGKKRDDLQEAIGFLEKEDFELPLQFNNFRD